MFSKKVINFTTKSNRHLLVTTVRHIQTQCKLLIVGGGSGGIAMAAKFSKILNKDEIVIVEPSEKHYYQPLFTLIGSGLKTIEDSYKPSKAIVPRNVKFFKDSVIEFSPGHNVVFTQKGRRIDYEYMIIAMGLQLNYEKIAGCVDALKDKNSGVCSIYSPEHVTNVYSTLCNVKEGNALFTFPISPIKCPGAPQKICYLADHIFNRKNIRNNITMQYITTLPTIFGVVKYAKALDEVAANKNIQVVKQRNLIEIDAVNKTAIFEDLSNDKERITEKYSVLHVTPPQSPPEALRKSKNLVNEAGFLNVDKSTLQHIKYKNIFGIGDCTNTPNSKTVAAVAAQSGVLYNNLKTTMTSNSKLKSNYDGYASCPLVTGFNKCILAEFDYQLQPKETFPIDQSKESTLMFHLKKDVMPALYWQLMVRGYWNGPETWRQVLHFGTAT